MLSGAPVPRGDRNLISVTSEPAPSSYRIASRSPRLRSGCRMRCCPLSNSNPASADTPRSTWSRVECPADHSMSSPGTARPLCSSCAPSPNYSGPWHSLGPCHIPGFSPEWGTILFSNLLNQCHLLTALWGTVRNAHHLSLPLFPSGSHTPRL